jgi:hypothetical protein
MRNFLVSFFLVAVVFISATIVTQAQRKTQRFNPDGSFWILGDAPNGFKDFAGFNLNAGRDRYLPRAGVDLTNGRHLNFKTVTATSQKLTFTTVALRGVVYSFEGKFLKDGIFKQQDLMDVPVLEGTLVKIVNGKKAAESKLKFTYFAGT